VSPLRCVRENQVWFAMAVQTAQVPAPQGRDMIAQHAAEGGVLGKVGKESESLGDGRVLTHTPTGLLNEREFFDAA